MAVDGQIVFAPVLAGQLAFFDALKKLASTGGQSLGRITGKASEFQKSLEASNARVIAFGASAGALFALKNGFDKLISSTIQTEHSLAEINTLLNLSREGLARFSSDLFKVANATSSAFSDAAKAANEFSRQGLGVEATLKRTNSALMLTKLSGLSLEDSVSSLTAALNGFGKEALEDIDIVNRLANVDAKFAVSSADLAEGLKRVSSSASDAGVGFNQIIALITAAQQTTARGGAVIGNSLKTILTRVQRPQVLEDLAAVGIAIKDLEGKSLPLISEADSGQASVLRGLANGYDSLSSSQKSFVAETVGGVYQINILKSLLGDLGNGFSIYDGAVKAADESTASAQKRIEALNDTISSRLIRTLTNLTKVSAIAGNALFAPTIKGATSTLDSLLKSGSSYDQEKGKDEINVAGKAFEGVLKGFGNVLAGPGIQLAAVIIIKLFKNLSEFIFKATGDLLGMNKASEERLNIEKLVIAELLKEKTVLNGLLSGTISLDNAHKSLLATLKQQSAETRNAGLFTPQITTQLQKSGVRAVSSSTSAFTPGLAIDYSQLFSKDSSIGGAVSDALKRENLATGGNALLSQSDKLISPQNPLGLAAIDGRSQSSAEQAIRQHATLGESLSQIKRKRTTSVPHLATGSEFGGSLILGFLPSLIEQLGGMRDGAGKLVKGLSTFGILLGKSGKELENKISTDRNAIKTELQWIDAVEKAKETQLKAGGGNFAFDVPSKFGKGHSSVGGGHLEEQLNQSQLKVAEFNKLLDDRKNAFRKVGLISSIGGGIAGGLASTFAGSKSGGQILGKNAPDIGAAIDDFTSGLTFGGQALSAFPNKFGKFAFGLSIATGSLAAIDTLAKGIEKERKNFGVINDANQRYLGEINNLISTISTLDGLYLDSSVSQLTLTKTQNKYRETLAKLASIDDEGSKLAGQIDSAGSGKEKIKLLQDAQSKGNNAIEKQAIQLQIRELGAERGITGFGTSLSGGLFGGNTESDVNRSTQILQSAASSIQASLSVKDKGNLIDFVNEKNGVFEELLKKNGNFNSFAKSIEQSGGGEKGIQLLVNQLKMFIGQERVNQNPKVKEVVDRERKINERGQSRLDLEIRNQQNLKKAFINTTAIAGSSIINKQNRENRGIFNKFELSDAKLRGQGRVDALFTDEETNRSRNVGFEVEKSKAEFAREKGKLETEGSSKFLGIFGKSFEEVTKNSNDRLTEDGTRTPIDPEEFKQIAALNDSVLSVVRDTIKSGGVRSLFDKDTGEVGENFLNKALSAVPENLREFVSNNLKSSLSSTDTQDFYREYAEREVELLENIDKTMDLQLTEIETMANEEKARRGAESFGGIRLLTDPKFAAEQRRSAIRAQVLSNSKDPLLRARGDALQLQLKQFAVGKIDRDKDAGLIKSVADGDGIAVRNFIRQAQITGNSRGANIARNTLSEGGGQGNSIDAVENAFKVGDSSVAEAVKKSIADGKKGIDPKKDDLIAKIDSFPKTLAFLTKAIEDSAKDINKIRDDNKVDREEGIKEITKAQLEAAKELKEAGISLNQKDLSKGFSKSGTFGNTAATTVAGAAIITALFAAVKGKQGFKDIGNNLKSFAPKADPIKNFLTKERGGPNLNPFRTTVDPKNVLTQDQLREISKKSVSFKEVNVKLIPKGIVQVDLSKYVKQEPLSRTPMPARLNIPPEKIAERDAKILGDLAKKSPIKVDAKAQITERINESSKQRFRYQTQNKGLEVITANKIKDALTFNPSKTPNPNLIEPAMGKPLSPFPVPKKPIFDLNNLSKSTGKSALILGGLATVSELLNSSANASDKVSGNSLPDLAENEKPETASGNTEKRNPLLEILKSVAISVAGGKASDLLFKNFKLTDGLFKGGPLKQSFGKSLGVGLLDDLVVSRFAAPEGEGNQHLRTASSFLPDYRMQIAARAGIRAGEAINYLGGGGKQNELTALQNNQTSDLYAQNPVLEKGRQIKEYIRGDRGKQTEKATSEYVQQLNYLNKNGSELAGLKPEVLKQIFEALGERIDNLRKGIENEALNGEEAKPQEANPSISLPPINIEISVKDIDRLPEIFNTRIIQPLEDQLNELRERLGRTESVAGINPSPSSL